MCSAGGAEMERVQSMHLGGLTSGQADVREFALRVVSELVHKTGPQVGKPEPSLLELMLRLSKSADPRLFSSIYDEMKRKRISAEQVVDIYLPAAISRIGDEWHESEMDILQATLAMARLQSLLREITLVWSADRSNDCQNGRVFLALPPGEQHVLGAVVAANQMRRLGVSVKLSLLPTLKSVERDLSEHRFHAVFLSVSNRDALPACRELVQSIRANFGSKLPIAMGGGIISLLEADHTAQQIAQMVGVNFASNSISKALTSCGLDINQELA